MNSLSAIQAFFLIGLFFVFSGGKAQVVYTSPVNGSMNNNPETNIIIKFQKSSESRLICEGTHILTESGDEITFSIIENEKECLVILKPDLFFHPGGNVRVSFEVDSRGRRFYDEIEFSIRQQAADLHVVKTVNSIKKFILPEMEVIVNNNPSEGYLFFHNMPAETFTSEYICIMQNDLSPVFSRDMGYSGGVGFDLQPSGYLSFWDSENLQFMIMDSSYSVIDSFSCGNGYVTDFHDFVHLEDGSAYLLSVDKQVIDMSAIVSGGNPQAEVEGLVLQKINSDKNVVFQWRSWDHYQITDARYSDLTSPSFEYVHCNSIEPLPDGNVMISCREMDEITNINTVTGQIAWRLGGNNNQFSFINDTLPFCMQHDVRLIGNGNITLLDNGNCHSPKVSSAREYVLDTVNYTAELVWCFYHPDSLFGRRLGNVQRLSNGNTFINWGQPSDFTMPAFTEVTPQNQIVYEARFVDYTMVYRAHRYLWQNPQDTLSVMYPEELSEMRLKIWPVPVTDILSLQMVGMEKDVHISVYNMSDLLCLRKEERLSDDSQIFFLSVKELRAGLYILKVSDGINELRSKFIKL